MKKSLPPLMILVKEQLNSKRIMAVIFLLKVGLASAQTMINFGPSAFVSLSKPIAANTSLGFEMSVVRKKSERYYLGMNVSATFAQTKAMKVDYPYNLQSDETLQSEFGLMGVHLENRFNLLPESSTNIFIEGNIGLRLGKYETTHRGVLGPFKTKETAYEKITGGLSVELMASLFVPVSEAKNGLLIKTGLVAGSAITYIDDRTVSYDGNDYTHAAELTSGSLFWVTSICIALNR